MKTRLAVLALLACGACRPDAAQPAPFALQRICAARIAELAAAAPRATGPLEPDAELRERVRGVVQSRARESGMLRAASTADLASIGAPAVPLLEELLDERELPPAERLSALEALGSIDTEASADALVRHVDLERCREPWLRAQAAFQLGKQSSDRALLRFVAQLKYETDGETVIWMAAALARHANYAGLEGLRVLAASGATEDVRTDAAAMQARLAHDAGFADAETLWAAWCAGAAAQMLPRELPSPALRLEAWRCIAALAEFDLRVVDDARFAISRSADWIVEPLCAALHEDDVRVRLHVAQCLERMGPRASRACGELVLALEEPRTAPVAAAALAAIGCADAQTALVAHLAAGNDAELRNACAAALGRLGARDAITALRGLLAAQEPLDLRQAAAQSLLALGDAATSTPVLVDCLTAPGADAGAAESALEDWLARRAASGDTDATALLERWRAQAVGDSTPTPTEDALRRRARALLLRDVRP